MRIATWNVNSIKARIGHLCRWLETAKPDVCLLQELKTTTESFPYLEVEALGYQAAVHGQKTYNGVAILSRVGLEDVEIGLPGSDGDDQARYIQALVAGRVRVASIYLPNGNPVDTDKFAYKLGWMERLRDHARTLLRLEEPLVLGGDYNIIPTPRDCHAPDAWRDDALFRLEARRQFQRLMGLGLTDGFRAIDDRHGQYSFWDYQANRWPRDEGIRIDHLILSPQAADRLRGGGIDRDPRGWERASDHTPVWCEFAFG